MDFAIVIFQMKKLLILSSFVFTFFGEVKANEINYNTMLDSIIPVEGVPYYSFRGKRGERSPLQFTYKTWKQHTNKPFSWASNPQYKEFTREIGIKHLKWLHNNIENPSPYRLALAWNAGLTAVNRGNLIESHFDYAERVRNIYNEKINKKLCAR